MRATESVSSLRLALGLFVFLVCAAATGRAQWTATVRGIVTRAGSREPIAGAVVRLAPKRAGLRVVGKTDKSGRFRLTEVAPGPYRRDRRARRLPRDGAADA